MRQRRLTYVFRCPICAKFFRMDEPGEPCCDGPSESSHDHPLEVMHLYSIEGQEVDPAYALHRSSGRLLVPTDLSEIDDEAKQTIGQTILDRRLIILP